MEEKKQWQINSYLHLDDGASINMHSIKKILIRCKVKTTLLFQFEQSQGF